MNWKPVILVFIATFFASGGQYLIKKGLNQIDLLPLINLINLNIIIGFLLYGISALLLIIALKTGKLSVIYPIISLGFVWLSLIASRFLGETLTILNWIGIAVIITGVSLSAGAK